MMESNVDMSGVWGFFMGKPVKIIEHLNWHNDDVGIKIGKYGRVIIQRKYLKDVLLFIKIFGTEPKERAIYN